MAEQAPRAAEGPLSDPAAEARRILDAGQEIPLRLLGGLAVAITSPGTPLLERTYKDIDFMTRHGRKGDVVKVFRALGYESDERFNQFNGHRLLMFWDTANSRQVDVFVGEFQMCHRWDVEKRIAMRRDTLPLADVLLTKLQIYALNEKDQRDIINLLFHHELQDGESDGAIDARYIAGLCAADWGLWRTVNLNIDRTLEGLPGYDLPADSERLVRDRLEDLRIRIDTAPKSQRWKLRSMVGERVKWYEEPEEVT